jgi:hypothetical protein
VNDELNAPAAVTVPARAHSRLARIAGRVVRAVAIVFVVLVAVMVIGDWIVKVPFFLAFGWFAFLRDNFAALQPNPRLMVEALLCVIALGVGAHYFCHWLYGTMAPAASGGWRARWTAMGVGLLFLLFAAGIGTIGLTHQAAWLIGAKEPFLRVDSYADRARVAEAIFAATELRNQVADEFARTGALPQPGAVKAPSGMPQGIVEGISLAQGGVVTIAIRREFNYGGTITLTPVELDGKLEWMCRSTLPPRVLPSSCRP